MDYVNLWKKGLATEKVVVKLKQLKLPPTGIEKYQYLQQVEKKEQTNSIKDFCVGKTKKLFCQL